VTQLRIGRLGGYFLEKLNRDVRARFEGALERLASAGAAVVELELRRLPDIATTYINVVLPEAFAYYAEALSKSPGAFSKGTRERLEMGSRISRDDYVNAQGDRATMRDIVDAALTKCDVLALPTLPVPAQKIGATTAMVGSAEEPLRPITLRLTQLFNLTGHPAISLPCGDSSDGMPCAVQLVGRRQQTSELARAAFSCEAYVSPREPSSAARP
jgi:aspartyl-tRNA(Asn)/glutamyl-tRNA(Gln) amidotransferase subunit A